MNYSVYDIILIFLDMILNLFVRASEDGPTGPNSAKRHQLRFLMFVAYLVPQSFPVCLQMEVIRAQVPARS